MTGKQGNYISPLHLSGSVMRGCMAYIPDPVSQFGSEVEDARTIKRSLMSHRYHHLIDIDTPYYTVL